VKLLVLSPSAVFFGNDSCSRSADPWSLGGSEEPLVPDQLVRAFRHRSTSDLLDLTQIKQIEGLVVVRVVLPSGDQLVQGFLKLVTGVSLKP